MALKRISLTNFKDGIPGYLWFCGILVQLILVFTGLQTILSWIEIRPTHRLAHALAEKLKDPTYCTTLFRGQEFAWQEERSFTTEDVSALGAELVKLTYRNQGSTGLSAEGYHIYRVAFEAEIRDTRTREVISFPPIAEMRVEVNRDDRVTDCQVDKLDGATSPQQDVRFKTCEREGWARRFLCDKGTERCYPMAQCEPHGNGA